MLGDEMRAKKKPGGDPGSVLLALEASNVTVIATKLLSFWQDPALLVGGPISLFNGLARNLFLRLLKRSLVETVLTAGCRSINTL